MPLVYRTASSTFEPVAPTLPPTVFHTLNWRFSRVGNAQDAILKAVPV
jgi:hypothetical protein